MTDNGIMKNLQPGRRDGKEESEGRWEKRKTVRKNKNREKEVDRTEQMKEIGCSTCASHE